MRLRLTVVHGVKSPDAGHGPNLHEVEIDGPEGSSASDLAHALAEHLGDVAASQVSVNGIPVAPDTPVGVAPLVDGVAVALSSQAEATPRVRDGVGAPLWLVVSHGPDAGHAYPLTRGGTSSVDRSMHI